MIYQNLIYNLMLKNVISSYKLDKSANLHQIQRKMTNLEVNMKGTLFIKLFYDKIAGRVSF